MQSVPDTQMKQCAIVDFFSAHDHLIPSAIQMYSDLGYEVTVFSPSDNFSSVSELFPSLKYAHIKTSKKINNAKGRKYIFSNFWDWFRSLICCRNLM